jgi:hypothetical protein
MSDGNIREIFGLIQAFLVAGEGGLSNIGGVFSRGGDGIYERRERCGKSNLEPRLIERQYLALL